MKDTIDILVRNVPISINKKLKIKAVKTGTNNVSLEVVEILKEKFKQ